MAKFTEIELTPDDPIFSEGPQVFVPMSRPLTKTPTKEDPMKEVRDALEAAIMELASKDQSEPTVSTTTPEKDEKN